MKETPTNDRPITTAKNDLFHRSEYARRISRVILKLTGNSCAAIGIQGRWGSGKTSLKNMVIEEIMSQKKSGKDFIEVVEFNPWLLGESKDVGSEMFMQLSRLLPRKNKNLEMKFAAFVSKLGYVDSALKFTQETAKPWTFKISAVIQVLKTVKVILDQKPLDQVAEELRLELLKEKLNILVVFDDIDRLSDKEIAALFRLVKSTSLLPGVTFLLLYDRDLVSSALDKVHHKRGEKYLEKIVQYPINVPEPPTEILLRIAETEINRLAADSRSSVSNAETRFRKIWKSCFGYYLTDPRCLFRYLNSLDFHIKGLTFISQERDFGVLEVDLLDLIALECIKVFEPKAFDKIHPLKHSLIGENSFLMGSANKERRESAIKEIADAASSSQHVTEILNYLFPPITSTRDIAEHSRRKLAIANHESFGRYFHLSTEPHDLSYADTLKLVGSLDDPHKFTQTCQMLKEAGKSDFFEWILSSLSLETDNIQTRVSSIASALDKVDLDESFFGLELSTQAANAIVRASRNHNGKKNLSPKDAIACIAKSNGVRLTAYTAFLLDMENDWGIDEETSQVLKKKACELISNMAAMDKLSDLKSGSKLLKIWKKFDEMAATSWIQDAVSTRTGAVRLVNMFASTCVFNGVSQPTVQYNELILMADEDSIRTALGNADDHFMQNPTCFLFLAESNRRREAGASN